MNKTKLKKIIEDPIDDSEIRKYLPAAKIFLFKHLSKYKTLQQLLPNDKDYFIMLYEQAPHNGHWVCLCNFNNHYEYFDSYGLKPSEPLMWNKKEVNKYLGQGKDYLNELLKKADKKVLYNPIEYQKYGPNINTCGRFCIGKILMMRKFNYDMNDFYNYMKIIKDKLKLSYDKIISFIIDSYSL